MGVTAKRGAKGMHAEGSLHGRTHKGAVRGHLGRGDKDPDAWDGWESGGAQQAEGHEADSFF